MSKAAKPVAPQKVEYNDAVAESKKYFEGDDLAATVWVSKYALKDSFGNIYETSPKQMHERIAAEIERIERKYPDPMSKEEVFELLDHFRYVIPQGGPMTGIGNNFQVASLSNCFVIGHKNPADSYGGIFRMDEEQVQLMKRRGITQEQAQRAVISNTTVIGAIMVHRGEADAMICGTIGEYHDHYRVVQPLFGYRDGVSTAGAMNALLLPSGNTFIADTYVNHDPSPEELAEITLMAAESVRRFGIEPRVALLSHSNFGSADCPSASKMRKTLELVKARAPELMIDGEMHGDAALVESIRNDRMPDSPLKGAANILVMPNMEAARISYNLLRVSSSEGVTVGPVLMGVAKPVHILTPIASVRRIVNMVALAVVEAQTEPL